LIEHRIAEGAHIYLVGSAGQIRVNGELVDARDSLAIRDIPVLEIEALDDAEFFFVEAWESQNCHPRPGGRSLPPKVTVRPFFFPVSIYSRKT